MLDQVKLDLASIPPIREKDFFFKLITCLRKMKHDRQSPAWQMIEARAAEIREGRAPEYGGKGTTPSTV